MILGYMAFLGIRNDLALREKESRRKLEISSQVFFSAIDSSLVHFMNEQASDSMLSQSHTGNPSLLAYFVKDTTSSQKLITHQLFYLPPDFDL